MVRDAPVSRGTANPTAQECLAHELGDGPATVVAMPARRRLGAGCAGGGEKWNRRGRGWGTLMRHFLLPLPLPVAALAPGMLQTAVEGGLIAAAGGVQGVLPRLFCAAAGAIALAAIAVAADQNGRPASGAEVASSGRVHGLSSPVGHDGRRRF